jgi:hypothetical protein
MSVQITTVTNSQSFGTWLTRTNQIAAVISANVVTTHTTAIGGFTSGNGTVNGYFGAQTVFVIDSIRGGNVTANAVLNVGSNTNFRSYDSANLLIITGNSTSSNIQSNVSTIQLKTSGNTSVIGANFVVNASANVNFNATEFLANTNQSLIGTLRVKDSTNTMFLVNTSNYTVTTNATTTTFNSNTIVNGTNFTSTSNATLSNRLNVTNTATFSNTVFISGATTLYSTIDVTSAATLSNTLSVTGNSDFSQSINVTNTAMFSNTVSVTGSVSLSNTLNVDGAANLESSANVGGTFGVTGAANLASTLGVQGDTYFFQRLTVTNSVSLSNTLLVTGAATLSNTFKVTGAANALSTFGVGGAANLLSTFGVTGAANLLSTFGVAGAANLASTLGVDGAANLFSTVGVSGAANLFSTLGVNGAVSIANTLNVTRTATFTNTMSVTGAVTMSNTLLVTNTVTFSNTFVLVGSANIQASLGVIGGANVGGSLRVAGDLVVDGSLSYTGVGTGDVVPASNLTYTIGNSENYWIESFVGRGTFSNGLVVGAGSSNSFFKTNLLFIETTNDRIGISTSTPGSKLTVAGTIESTTGGFKFPDGKTITSVVAGANQQIQFNDSSVPGAVADLRFNTVTKTLTVANTVSSNNISLSYGFVTSNTTSTSGTTKQSIDTFALGTYRSADYIVSVKDNNSNSYQVSKILVVHNDGSSYSTEYGIMQTNSTMGIFESDISGTNVRLLFTPVSTSTTIKVVRTTVSV